MLDFFFNGKNEVLLYGKPHSNPYPNFSIWALPRQTGVWALGRGNQMEYRISVHFSGEINLPSKVGRWFFDLMSWFATISGENSLPEERERFWDGNRF